MAGDEWRWPLAQALADASSLATAAASALLDALDREPDPDRRRELGRAVEDAQRAHHTAAALYAELRTRFT